MLFTCLSGVAEELPYSSWEQDLFQEHSCLRAFLAVVPNDGAANGPDICGLNRQNGIAMEPS